ncbi:MAG: toll/interleukin-1 receptor domain-containing protein [Ruminococcus sp.]|nr:toll/interleukin-1 receptor domain-containing protein [Ruminococcus sp.]
MSHIVFISYKSEEYKEAAWVRDCLIENDISCWMAPDSIPGGSSYADEIESAIETCQVFVLVLSKMAQTSPHIKKEIDRALNLGKPILPFFIENCNLRDAFNYYLTDVQRYNAFQDKSRELKRMIDRIRSLIGSGAEVKTVSLSPRPSLDIQMKRIRAFSSGGDETTVFTIKKPEDGQTVSVSVNFEKTALRDKIPEYAGVYYVKHPSADISGNRSIVFEARSEDRSIGTIWLEIKPEGRKWMHESIEIELTRDFTAYEIEISDFEFPETAHCVEEITFVVKPVSFTGDKLTGKMDIRDIKVV